ncbi:hypothetical protein Syun_030710 [Stephania yunnanensis]|uniref:Uncharacterized protein n=1 Tax=Stephania yunnanensis TaxID=152371 RepID=A0AAP0HFJ5_9MAGN
MSVKGNNIERCPSSLRPPNAGATGSGSQSRGNAKQTRSSEAASPEGHPRGGVNWVTE